jgi:hypothetical protein
MGILGDFMEILGDFLEEKKEQQTALATMMGVSGLRANPIKGRSQTTLTSLWLFDQLPPSFTLSTSFCKS